ncbi:MATE family efflux transporter [Mycoplasmatota bacterium]|nr:MATE family efflux transporter [Mycoplasmatota bacterium]
MADERIKILKDLPVSKSVIKLSLPATIGLLVMAIYNMVDAMFVSWLGTEAAGATQVIFPIVLVLTAVGVSIGIGGGSFASRLMGQENFDKANKVASTMMFVSVLAGLTISILGVIYIEPLVKTFGAIDDVLQYSIDYGKFIILGSIFQICNMTFNNLLRAEGSAKLSMIGMISGAILNIILDPILIFGLGMGIKGAAIATSFSQFVTFIILASQYIRGKSLLKIRVKDIKLSKEIFVESFKMGSPTFARQMLMTVAMVLLNNQAVIYGGNDALAAFGISLKATAMIGYGIFGLGQGYQPVAGYNYGAKSYKRVYDSSMYTIKIGTIYSLIMSLLVLFFGKYLLLMYKPSESVLEVGIIFLKYYAPVFILMNLNLIVSVYYQAIGEGTKAFVLSIARQGIFLIPLIIYLPNIIGLTGLFLSQPLADLLTLVLTFTLFIPEMKKLKSMHNITT